MDARRKGLDQRTIHPNVLEYTLLHVGKSHSVEESSCAGIRRGKGGMVGSGGEGTS